MTPRNDIAERVDAYVHGLLSPEEAQEVEERCRTSPEWKTALAQARRRLTAIQAVPPSEASPELVARTVERVSAQKGRRPRFRRYLVRGVLATIAAWAVAAAVVVAVHIYYANLTASPYDVAVLGQNRLMPDARGALQVRVVDKNTGKPVAGAPVTVELRQAKSNKSMQLAKANTDSFGIATAKFQTPDWDDGSYELCVIAQPSGKTETLTQSVQLQRSAKVMLTSDKPIYQPGQTIHVRSLALRKQDLKPVAKRDAVFTVMDPKGNLIFKRKLTTSDYGIAAIDCELASELIEGSYAIACSVDNTESKINVEVKKYVLPKFKLDVELDRPYYQSDQTVRGKVKATYFFGKPVANAIVDVGLSAGRVPPRMPGGWPQQEPLRGPDFLRTNADGEVSFELALKDLLWGWQEKFGDLPFRVNVAVTDSAGQKQNRTLSRVITSQPMRLEVIPEGGALVEGVPNTVYLYCSYADGQPAAKAKLEVSSGQQPLTTNDLGVASFEITPSTPETTLLFHGSDDQGRKVERTVKLVCGPGNDDFLVRLDKAVYNGGDTIHMQGLGAGQEPIFIDLIKDGQTVLTTTIEPAKNPALDFDLPADLFGTLELCAYRYNTLGQPVRKLRTLYVRAPQQLAIATKFDKDEYRPGDQAKLQLTLTDSQGKPTAGAISLSAVDEAVFAVLEQMPGMERTFYLLEQELLKPVYTIYNWSPDFSTSLPVEERNRFEQALFAKTATTILPPPPPPPPTNQRPNRGGPWAPQPQPDIMIAPGDPDGAPGQMLDRPASTTPKTSPHSLAASSHALKVAQTDKARDDGLTYVAVGYTLLVAALFLIGYLCFWLFVRPIWVVLAAHGIGLAVLGPVVLCAGFMSIFMLGAKSRSTFEQVGATMAMDMAQAPEMAKWREDNLEADRSGMSGGRVRHFFPETLLWKPELITDDQGRASLDVDLADSITTYRLTASAVSADGKLGATRSDIRVFQPFFVELNLPVTLTRGDEVAVPVVVYNYHKEAQKVELTLAEGTWFERRDDASKTLELKPGEVLSTHFRIKAAKVGQHHLQVAAVGSGVRDEIKRGIEVVPDGKRVEQPINGNLQQAANLTLNVPANAIDGSPRAILKIYPSTFSQLVEGLDNIFQMPSGCFEQTSSTLYPNLLALDYLKRTNQSRPDVEAKAKGYIHSGYQRLLTFEVAGGGFDWFGRPPANRRLTAYGLMEFEDMAKVHDVDPKLTERTRQWLLKGRNADGSWDESPGLHMENDPGRGQKGENAKLAITAYIAWAVFRNHPRDANGHVTRSWLLRHKPESIDDPYLLALTCNALTAVDPDGKDAQPYLSRLEGMKKTSEDGKLVWWVQAANTRTTFYGHGNSGDIETTAMAVLALQAGNQNPGAIRQALAWLIQKKDGSGTWFSTQATVLSLKALVAAASKPTGGDAERRFELTLGDKVKQEIVIAPDQAEVLKMIDLSAHLTTGEQRLTLTEKSTTAANFQVDFRYHVPGESQGQQEPLAIELTFDRHTLKVGETLTVTAVVKNRTEVIAPMVMLDLPIPAGFTLERADLDQLVKGDQGRDDLIDKYQVTPRSVIVYLSGLKPDRPMTLRYRLKATMPADVQTGPARAWEYYNVDNRGFSKTAKITVAAR